jgi:hypothetical protein
MKSVLSGCVALAAYTMVFDVHAACSGSGLAWMCTAGSSASDVQDAVDGASDGATLTFAAGGYSWSEMIRLSNDRGVTLLCEAERACDVEVNTGTVLALNGELAGDNNRLYRVSGFSFRDAPASALVFWFWGAGTLRQQLLRCH